MLKFDPHWSLVDLDPRTWRNIGHFFPPGQYIRAGKPEEHALFVLHQNGKLLRVVDTAGGVRSDLLDKTQAISEPQTLAQDLFEKGEWERVHVINKAHLAQVARTTQSSQPDSIDHYYRSVYHSLWDGSDGYVTVPARSTHWHSWTYQAFEDLVGQLPASKSCVALGVFEGQSLNIGLIVILEEGLITKVTTFETLSLDFQPELSTEFLDFLVKQLQKEFGMAAVALLCTQTTFDEWVNTENDKWELLTQAKASSNAFWKISDNS